MLNFSKLWLSCILSMWNYKYNAFKEKAVEFFLYNALYFCTIKSNWSNFLPVLNIQQWFYMFYVSNSFCAYKFVFVIKGIEIQSCIF